MKYTPVQLEENVNVSTEHPLVELFWLLGGLILVAGVFFVLLGVITDWAASKTPISVENWLGDQGLKQFPADESAALNERLQGLLDQLPVDSPLHQYDFRVYRVEQDEVNAVALPGGNIMVFSGLLQEVESENELAMILAHELGHFAHRDHLRGLGRGLGLVVASALFFGENNAISSLISKALLTFQVRYSQSQESAADQFGLDLLVRRYGHAAGSTDFFVRSAKEAGSGIPYILASHPHPEARIEHLEQLIWEQGYPRKSMQPLSADLISESE
jgi:predicted Zn-dependent protease